MNTTPTQEPNQPVNFNEAKPENGVDAPKGKQVMVNKIPFYVDSDVPLVAKGTMWTMVGASGQGLLLVPVTDRSDLKLADGNTRIMQVSIEVVNTIFDTFTQTTL